MSRLVGTLALAVVGLAAGACGGGDDAPLDAAPGADGRAADGPVADGAIDDGAVADGAVGADAAAPDAGLPPPPTHPPRLVFLSEGTAYLVEWQAGVPQPPVALIENLSPGATVTWSADGHVMVIPKGNDLAAVAFDAIGALPVQTLPNECATCWIDAWGLSPDGRHAYINSSHDADPPWADLPHDLDLVDLAEDGTFGVRQHIAGGSYNGDLLFPSQWSPDSTSLLWRWFVREGIAQLILTRVDGAMPVHSNITDMTLLGWDEPMWCPDSKRALFITSGAPAQPGTVGLTRGDLSGVTPVPLSDLDASLRGLVWTSAPDCHAVVFGDLSPDGSMYAVDTHAAQPGTPVDLGAASWPTWSPDSRWLVTSRTRPEAPDELVLTAYDTTQGVPGPAVDLGTVPGPVTTSWRDDSKQVVVRARAAAQTSTSYLVNVSSTGFATPQVLTFPQSGLDVYSTAWSADRRWIAYFGNSSGQRFGGVIDADSGSATDLGHVGASSAGPWAPGTNLLAVKAAAGNPDVDRLQVIDLSAPGAVPVTVDDGHTATSWTWQP